MTRTVAAALAVGITSTAVLLAVALARYDWMLVATAVGTIVVSELTSGS